MAMSSFLVTVPEVLERHLLFLAKQYTPLIFVILICTPY